MNLGAVVYMSTVVPGWLAGWWLFRRVPGLPRSGSASAAATTVSVVIPARDEAASLPGLLTSLASQARRPDETIVVDDHSRDGTAAVAAAAGATVLAAPALPPGWTGKAWACWNGAHRATGEVLVFLDADTTLGPDALLRLLGTLDGGGGIVSVQPWHYTVHRYERLSAYFNVIATMGTGLAAGRAAGSRPVGPFGPCIAVRRREYFRHGGHRVVQQEILDDLALAKHFPQVRSFGGTSAGTVGYRMYPHGLGQLVEGWSKNFAAGASATPLVRLALIVTWLGGSILASPGGWPAAPGSVIAAAAYLAYAGQFAAMLGQLGRFGPMTAAAFPVCLAGFIAIFLRSLLLSARGRARWKDREVMLQ